MSGFYCQKPTRAKTKPKNLVPRARPYYLVYLPWHPCVAHQPLVLTYNFCTKAIRECPQRSAVTKFHCAALSHHLEGVEDETPTMIGTPTVPSDAASSI